MREPEASLHARGMHDRLTSMTILRIVKIVFAEGLGQTPGAERVWKRHQLNFGPGNNPRGDTDFVADAGRLRTP